MDRDGAIRASRRRQALDALTFERDREAVLVLELEDVLAGADGTRVDAGIFAHMSEDETALVRAALGEVALADEDEEDDEDETLDDADDFGFSDEFDDDEADPGADTGDEVEDEVTRLQEEIESSRRIQAALERYVELLSTAPDA